jgi:hypothetical protein
MSRQKGTGRERCAGRGGGGLAHQGARPTRRTAVAAAAAVQLPARLHPQQCSRLHAPTSAAPPTCGRPPQSASAGRPRSHAPRAQQRLLPPWTRTARAARHGHPREPPPRKPQSRRPVRARSAPARGGAGVGGWVGQHRDGCGGLGTREAPAARARVPPTDPRPKGSPPLAPRRAACRPACPGLPACPGMPLRLRPP